MKITFESDNKKLQAHLDELARTVAPAAQAAALNSAAKHVRSKAVGIASKATGVPTKILRRRIAIPRRSKATQRSLEVFVFGGLWPVKVADLTPAPRKLKSGAVKYKTGPGQPIDPMAFIANNTNGRLSVFARKGRSRLPVKNVTIDISGGVKSAIGGYLISRAAQSHYEKILLSQMDRRVRSSLMRRGMRVS